MLFAVLDNFRLSRGLNFCMKEEVKYLEDWCKSKKERRKYEEKEWVGNFALEVARQWLLVVLVKIDWWQSKTSRGEEGNVLGSGLLGICSRGKKLGVLAEFCAWSAALWLNFDRVGGDCVLVKNLMSVLWRVVWEAYSVMWILGVNSAFALRPRKSSENFVRGSRSQDLPDAYRVLASNPAFKYTNNKGSFCLCSFFIYNNVRICLTKIFIVLLDEKQNV